MRKYINGEYYEMTEEEIAEMQTAEPTETEEEPSVEKLLADLQARLQEQIEINEAQDESLIEIFESILA